MKILSILTMLSLSACASWTQFNQPTLVDHAGRSEQVRNEDAFKCSGESFKYVHANEYYLHCMLGLGYAYEIPE